MDKELYPLFIAWLIVKQYDKDKSEGNLHFYDADELRGVKAQCKKIIDSKIDFYDRC